MFSFKLLTVPIFLRERLHLTSSFPSSNVLVRNPEGDAARSLYLANDIVKTIVQNNDYARLRLNSAGTKVFSKQDGGRGVEPQFRVLGEGLPVILPYADPETIIIVDVASLRILVETYYPLCSTFAEPFRGVIEARRESCRCLRFASSSCSKQLREATSSRSFPLTKMVQGEW